MQDESGSKRNLRQRAHVAVIPDNCSNNVFARGQVASNINSFKSPMEDVAPGRSKRDKFFIYHKLVTVVGRDVDYK